jgi:hypothetical protein
MNTKLKYLLTSRKFWAAFIGLALMTTKTFKPDFPIAEEELTNIVYILVAYIVGTSIETKARSG